MLDLFKPFADYLSENPSPDIVYIINIIIVSDAASACVLFPHDELNICLAQLLMHLKKLFVSAFISKRSLAQLFFFH